MPIPVDSFYQGGELGAGKPATIQQMTVNSEVASAPISYGQAVTLTGGKVAPATAGPIYGVALSRVYENDDRFIDPKADTWLTGETVPVIREGTVAVPISADVDKGDNATVDATGLFKPAGASDSVVGIFITAGNSGHTAALQTGQGYNAQSASSQQPSTPAKQCNHY